MSSKKQVKLERKGDQLMARIGDDAAAVEARIVWARPITGRGREVSVLKENKELAYLQSLDELDAESRKIAEEELAQRYLIPRITRVIRTDVDYGDRSLRVDTNRGEITFLIKDVNHSVNWLSDDSVIIKDVLGNRYEITSIAQLDDRSRTELDRVF